MIRKEIFFTVVSLFSTLLVASGSNTTDEDLKLKELLDGKRISCNSFKPALTPSINFETLSTNVLINESSTQLSLQMKIIYYRCLKTSEEDNSFSIVDLKTPYQYEVAQFDGTITNIKVSTQQHRFSAFLNDNNSLDIKKGIPARVETEGLSHLVRFDLNFDQILSAKQKLSMQKGEEVTVSIRTLSALSSDYKIGTQTSDNTGFIPGSQLIWRLKLKMHKKIIKVELTSISPINS